MPLDSGVKSDKYQNWSKTGFVSGTKKQKFKKKTDNKHWLLFTIFLLQ